MTAVYDIYVRTSWLFSDCGLIDVYVLVRPGLGLFGIGYASPLYLVSRLGVIWTPSQVFVVAPLLLRVP